MSKDKKEYKRLLEQLHELNREIDERENKAEELRDRLDVIHYRMPKGDIKECQDYSAELYKQHE